jgi:DNA gyrase subunit A
MRESYIDFARSVITSRALPDVRDGLKPVQRRVLYAMDELSLRPNGPHKKSARIVGEVLGKYHPHSDVAVYDTMVRLAQTFSMRYPPVDGQGNFGSIDGDPPAAMRYTEARLSAIAEEMLADIDKNTVDFQPNFDGSLREPSVLPAKLPYLLVNGSVGIAVGMATNIPPHNLTEVIGAIALMIERYGGAVESGLPFGLVWSRVMRGTSESDVVKAALASLPKPLAAQVRQRAELVARRPSDEQMIDALLDHLDQAIDVSADDLMQHIKGPDFPTWGMIVGDEGIKLAYTTGHGRIVIRAKVHTEDLRGNREAIVVTELPYQVNKATLVEKIADLVRDKRIDGISDMRDESDRQGMRLVIELKRDTNARAITNQLFKMTAMQSAFSINMLALVDGAPRVLTLKQILLQYVNWRHQVLTRRTEFELEKARARAHILEGLRVALDNLDEVVRIIRAAADTEAARQALMKRFSLSELQATAILDMQLRRLAALERRKILDELKEVLSLVARLEDLLANPVKILFLARDELTQLRDKFGDERRTRILYDASSDLNAEDLVPEQDVVVLSTVRDYVRRLPGDAFRVRRSIRGVSTTISQEEDAIRHLLIANTRDTVVFFSNRGKMYAIKGHELPEQQAKARGLPLSNLTGITREEKVSAVVPIKSFAQAGYFIFVTRGGEVKKTAVKDYASARANGLIAMDLPPGDELVWVGYTPGGAEISIITEQGQSIRFKDGLLRAASRQSGGVRGIKLIGKDQVVDANIVDPEGDILLVTARGFGKRVPISQFTVQGRGGGGIRVMPVSPKTGSVVVARIVRAGDEVMIASREGVVVRQPVLTFPPVGRPAQGAVMIQLAPKDVVAAMARLRASDDDGDPATPPRLPGLDEPDGSGQGPGGTPGGNAGPSPTPPPSASDGGQRPTARASAAATPSTAAKRPAARAAVAATPSTAAKRPTARASVAATPSSAARRPAARVFAATPPVKAEPQLAGWRPLVRDAAPPAAPGKGAPSTRSSGKPAGRANATNQKMIQGALPTVRASSGAGRPPKGGGRAG